MAIAHPVAVYSAATNQEAMLLKHMLIEAGIEADVTQDLSLAGLWIGGSLPGVHTPKVWVDKSQGEAAATILKDFEQKRADRAKAGTAADGPPVDGTCEECGATSQFPAAQQGTVQTCPKCEKAMDVGPAEDGDWWKADGDEPGV